MMTFFLIKEIYKPSIVLFFSLLLLYLGKVISLDDAFAGFSNHGMLAVGVLFILATALQSSSVFDKMVTKSLGDGRSKFIYFRLMLPVSFISAFLNNTPVVASIIPLLKKWSKKNDLSVSKFLIPLSFAAILGGFCTLIGTSTNLVVHGMLLDHGLAGFSFFELGKVGLPVAIAGILYFSLGGHRLLPERKDSLVQFGEHTREFVVALKVDSQYPNLGKSIEDANLRHLKGLYLFQIIRDGKEIAPVSSQEKIRMNDRLFFTGLPETIYELQKTPGLHVLKDSEFDLKNIDSDKLKTFEAVISNSSPLIGQTVRDCDFRTKYNAVILGIHRGGERIKKKVGDIELKPNDTLFLFADKNFEKKWYHSRDFSLVSLSVDEYSKPKNKGNFAFLLLFLMVAAVTTGLIESMLIAASLTAVIMIMSKIISFTDAKNSVDFDVLLVIASALGIGKAVETSGLADMVVQHVVYPLHGLGIVGIIAGLFIITNIYTQFITNTAAVALMFPVALATAQIMNVAARPLIITITIAASACFSSPLGYQTNLMVYNPGGYKFMDFVKAGLLLNVLVGVIVTVTVYFLYF